MSKEEFSNSLERMNRKSRMTPRTKDNGEDFGKCGCGRSPTGKCIGWHGLTEDEYQKRLEEFNRTEQSGNTAG
jgi:hypothetical protein